MNSAQHKEPGSPEQLEVILLSPPYDFPPRPSIALSLFRQCLNEAGMRSRVFYPMFRLSHLLGIEAARKIDAIPYTAGLQEYLFAHMTDAENDCSDERFARLVCRDFPIYPYEELLSLITYAGEKARQAVEELAQEIARILRVPAAFSVESFARGQVELIGFQVTESSPLAGISLIEYNRRNPGSILLCAAKRGDEVIVPNGHFVPLPGDLVHVIGSPNETIRVLKRAGKDVAPARRVSIHQSPTSRPPSTGTVSEVPSA